MKPSERLNQEVRLRAVSFESNFRYPTNEPLKWRSDRGESAIHYELCPSDK
jgi:hypothetical protein